MFWRIFVIVHILSPYCSLIQRKMASGELSLSKTGQPVVQSHLVLDPSACQIESESNIISWLSKIDQRLESLEPRLSAIESCITKLHEFENSMRTITSTVKQLGEDISSVKRTVTKYETDLNGLNNLYDGLAYNMNKLTTRCTKIEKRVVNVESGVTPKALVKTESSRGNSGH